MFYILVWSRGFEMIKYYQKYIPFLPPIPCDDRITQWSEKWGPWAPLYRGPVHGQIQDGRQENIILIVFCFASHTCHSGYHSGCRMRGKRCSLFRSTWSNTQPAGCICCSVDHWLDIVFVSHLLCNDVHRFWVMDCEFYWSYRFTIDFTTDIV